MHMTTMTTPASTFTEIDPSTLQSWLAQGSCTLVDVREPDEHARERIEGAGLHPLSRFQPGAVRAAPGDRVVLHCRSGRRSADAARMLGTLSAAGVHVHSLRGGIEAWKQAGLPVKLDTRVSGMSVMRQVQLTIGACVLAGSALAWFVDPRFVAVPAFFGAGLCFAGLTGTCGLAAVIGWMPWNRVHGKPGSCASGSCTT
jgi:rhodanese-related sulfurtransferase